MINQTLKKNQDEESVAHNENNSPKTKEKISHQSLTVPDKDQTQNQLTETEMLNHLSAYEQIQKFCKDPLTPQMKDSTNPLVCISNFSIDIKLALINIVIVGLTVLPGMALATIILLELLYLTLNITTYCRLRHYSSWVLLTEQMLRALLYLICVTYLFISYLGLKKVYWMFNAGTQESLAILLLIGRLAEYLFLIMMVLSIIVEQIQNFLKKRKEQQGTKKTILNPKTINKHNLQHVQ